MKHYRPKRFFLILTAIFIAAGTFAASWYLGIGLLYGYLLSVNVLTFLMYGFDKRSAIVKKGRVPEVVLHVLALASGSPAAFCGQMIFRHKTQKKPFKLIFICIVILQIVGIALYYFVLSNPA